MSPASLGARSAFRPSAARAAVPALVVVGALVGCAPLDPPARRAGEDPFDRVHAASYETLDPASRTVAGLPSGAHRRRFLTWLLPGPRPRPLPPPDPIHPDLRWRLTLGLGAVTETLIVTFTDPTRLDPFPPVPRGETRGDSVGPAVDSVRALNADRVAEAVGRRAARYAADSLDLTLNYGVTVRKTYWLLQAMQVTMPLDSVEALARRSGITGIRPNRGNPPPDYGDPVLENDVAHALDQIGLDHYLDLGLGYGWMALLDTGVQTTHPILCGDAPRLCMVADCVTGAGLDASSISCGAFVECYTPGGGDAWPTGHGTRSAAILVGNARLGERYAGITRASLDCFKVYGSDGRVDAGAALRALEIAVQRGNRVILVETQEIGDGALTRAADRAYAAGAAVIAANGNFVGWLGEPARGRHVIGAGGYHVRSEEPIARFKGAMTPDRRHKPDLLGPTETETARADDNLPLDVFGGTSGAAPYVAGAACALGDWLRLGETPSEDPGQIYAHLVLGADGVGPFDDQTVYGAGRLRLPTAGTSRWGKTWVSYNAPSVDIPIEIAPDETRRLEVAIWWPEGGGATLPSVPNDLTLEIHRPGWWETLAASSNSPAGVFERAAVAGEPALEPGRWIVRIKGENVATGGQTVYWAAALRAVGAP